MIRFERARRDFGSFRKLINPKLKRGWFQFECEIELQAFAKDLAEGKRPKLVIEAPPQHGKSFIVIDFIAWISGRYPDLRTIYASFSKRLGVRANLRLQRIYESEVYRRIFPATFINTPGEELGRFLRNSEILEYVGKEGSFRNTTINGAINGEGLDLGVIDDPLKGREAARSETIRNKTWEWFTDDFFTRFSEDSGLLAILTRWHLDDPIGRLTAIDPSIKVLKFRAIAIEDEKHRKKGEALFPEHKSIEFLLERKALMTSANWESLYQQSPIKVGGDIIKGEWFGRYGKLPKIKFRKIFGDTAQKTAERNDFSVLECWGKGANGGVYLIDMIRGKWTAPELKRRTIAFWEKHKAIGADDPMMFGPLRALMIEDKSSGTGLIQEIKEKGGIPVKGIERTRDKYTRVDDVLTYIEAGQVHVPEDAPFTSDFIEECEAFTADDSHAHDDQIDPMVDAINDMIAGGGTIYDNL